MLLNKISKVQSGYISRERIDSREEGSHFLLQVRDVDAYRLNYRTDNLIRFNPDMSRSDWLLKAGDILFMSRGARNFSVLLHEIPDVTLAAAYFFIVRALSEEVMPGYLCWYLNQEPAELYFRRHSGRGVHMPVVRRSVLEGIDIPLPPLEVQKKLVELDALMREEENLLNSLAEKRRELVTASCLKVVRGGHQGGNGAIKGSHEKQKCSH